MTFAKLFKFFSLAPAVALGATSLALADVQVFDASGTWTKTGTPSFCFVEAFGGGASSTSGNATAGSQPGGGGGAVRNGGNSGAGGAGRVRVTCW